MKFIPRELSRLLKVLVPRHSVIAFGPATHEEVIQALDPSQVMHLDDLSPLGASKPDHVVMLAWLDGLDDIYMELRRIHSSIKRETRVIVFSVSRLWSRRSKKFGKTHAGKHEANWIPPNEIQNFFEQAGFEMVSRRRAISLPIYIPVVSRLANRWLSDMPFIRHLSVFNVMAFRPIMEPDPITPSVSIIVAARNEAGNIRNLVDRLPQLAPVQELIFVEGGSQDQTWDVIQGVMGEPDVAYNFETNRCEFANGSRLVYQMERQAMQFLNLLGNRLFGTVFTFLLGQSVRDTLCGTKALWASAYRQIASERSFFGDFDPFGDFDLLFGASRLGLKIRDVPVHYKERVYGSTNISRFRHGFLLIRMTTLAARRIKFI